MSISFGEWDITKVSEGSGGGGSSYTAGKNISINNNIISSDQYPLFTVNSGNLDVQGNGDLVGDIEYETTIQNNYTYVGDDYPSSTSDGIITCGYNGTPVSPNTSVFDFSTFFSHNNWRLVEKVKGSRTVQIALCKSYQSNSHNFSDPALVVTFNPNISAGSTQAGTGYQITDGGSVVAYDAATLNYTSQYAYFSIMRSGDTVYIQQSSDKQSWTTLASFSYSSIVNTSNLTRFYFKGGRDILMDLANTYVEINEELVWFGYGQVSKASTMSFKIGGTYPLLKATNGQGIQFTKSTGSTIDLSQATDGDYTAFVTPSGNIYVNKGTVYVQKTQPVMVTDDVWLNTSVYPYQCVASDGLTEFTDVPFATFTLETQLDGSVSVGNVKTLPYNYFQVTMNSIKSVLAYPTGGEVLVDPKLYNYIKGMYDTGIDTLENTYTFEGSPTITSDGWINGFSNDQYCELKDNDILRDAGNKDFIINLHIIYKPADHNQALLQQQRNTAYANYIALSANTGEVAVAFGTMWDEGAAFLDGTTPLVDGQEYWIRVVRSDTNLSLFLSTDGTNFTLESTTDTFTQSVNPGSSFLLGRSDGNYILSCESYIDLNGFNYTVIDSGSFVGKYFDCKYLSSGSKCVDISKASIINSMAKSVGSALYYIIDTTNQTLILPQGDIFGFISQALR